MELRSIEDWTLLKEFKSVPNVVDVSDFGGTVREYQVRVDPNKLVSYGLSIGQVEQQLSNNNINAGGSFVEVRPAADERPHARALQQCQRHRADRPEDPERDRPSGEGHRRGDAGSQDPAGHMARPTTWRTGASSTSPTSFRASC
jgi:hypothetical protein